MKLFLFAAPRYGGGVPQVYKGTRVPVMVRVPLRDYEKVASLAAALGVSMNDFVLQAIKREVERRG